MPKQQIDNNTVTKIFDEFIRELSNKRRSPMRFLNRAFEGIGPDLQSITIGFIRCLIHTTTTEGERDKGFLQNCFSIFFKEFLKYNPLGPEIVLFTLVREMPTHALVCFPFFFVATPYPAIVNKHMAGKFELTHMMVVAASEMGEAPKRFALEWITRGVISAAVAIDDAKEVKTKRKRKK